jgi:hypothetical protein
MQPCAPAHASLSVDILALFESTTGEIFTDTPGTLLAARVLGLGRAMSNIVREVVFEPPMLQVPRRNLASWTRRPCRPMDVQAWRAGTLQREQFQAPVVPLQTQLADSNAGLADWIRNHRYLRPVEVESGESGMALLLLWEVDHQRAFPRSGGEGTSAVLLGFTRRLKQRIKQDAELCQWLECRDMQKPLAPGLPASHHFRWSVRVVPPAASEPQGWYEDFAQRWRAFLHELGGAATPATTIVTAADGSSSSSAVSTPTEGAIETNPGLSRRRAPKRRQQPSGRAATAPAPQRQQSEESQPQAPTPPPPQAATDAEEVTLEPPVKRRQVDLRRWLVPSNNGGSSTSSLGTSPTAVGAGHGRAVQSSPT